jgi:hypothetical protein
MAIQGRKPAIVGRNPRAIVAVNLAADERRLGKVKVRFNGW